MAPGSAGGDRTRDTLELEPRYAAANNLLAWTEAFAPELRPDSLSAIEGIYRTLRGSVSTADVITALAIARWRAGDVAGSKVISAKIIESPYASHEAKVLAAALAKETDAPEATPRENPRPAR